MQVTGDSVMRIIFLIISTFILGACINESSTDDDTQQALTVPKWIHQDTSIRTLNILSHDQEEGMIVLERLDSACLYNTTSNQFIWQLPDLDTNWYAIQGDTLKRGFTPSLNFTTDYTGGQQFEDSWSHSTSYSTQTWDISSDFIVETNIINSSCYSDEYVFEGSSAQALDCDSYSISLQGNDVKVSGGYLEYGSGIFYEFEDYVCLIRFTYPHSKETCGDIQSTTHGDCGPLFERLEELSPGKINFCSHDSLDDGECSTDCINLDVDPDC